MAEDESRKKERDSRPIEVGKDLEILKETSEVLSDEELYALFLSQGEDPTNLASAAGISKERLMEAVELAATNLGSEVVERLTQDAAAAREFAENKGLGLQPPEDECEENEKSCDAKADIETQEEDEEL